MCTFITLIAATDDVDGLNAILARQDRRGHSRRAETVDTPGLRLALTANEQEYWLVRSPCDCGTFLGHAARRHEDGDAEMAAIARYRRKGWSDARIKRAISDRQKADARPLRHIPNEDADYWIDLLTAIAAGTGLKHLGLMHHNYRLSPGSEPDTANRVRLGPLSAAIDQLAAMEDGVIYNFDFGS